MEVTYIKRFLVIMTCCLLLCMMTACSSDAPEEAVSSDNTAQTETNSGWKYYDEMPSVPTPDSCIDDVIFETTFEEDGNRVYGYYVSTDKDTADQKYNQYLEILEGDCGFQFVKKPNTAIARRNGESLFGLAIGESDKGVYLLDVLFFTSDKDSGSDYSDESPSSEYPTVDKKQSSTMGEEQALKKALDYLNYTAFSYTGLVKQLEYEGFSHSEAVYGADNCEANWNEQAARKAHEYIDYTSFSRDSLIKQLEYEGFTHNQAEYGASAVGY